MNENFFDQPQEETKRIKEISDYVLEIRDPNSDREAQELPGKEIIDKEAELFFQSINPNGELLADVRKKLEKEIEIKKKLVEQNKINAYENHTETISAIKFQINDLQKWINYIDEYLSSSSPEAMREFRAKIEADKFNIHNGKHFNTDGIDLLN